jgi:feruloyl esterase
VKTIWAGSRTGAGEVVFPGLVPGGESAPGGWVNWVSGGEPFTGLHWLAAEGFFKYMVFGDPQWDFRGFDYDRDLPVALARVGAALDAADPDLRPFRDRGGKLIVYHGWSDADISPLASIDYFERVAETIGGGAEEEAALEATQDFFRLFMVPGMGHCRGGPGADRFDALAALESWVENDEAPQRIVATKLRGAEVVRSRPLCPYPQVARWSGTGSTDEAANFSCGAAPP